MEEKSVETDLRLASAGASDDEAGSDAGIVKLVFESVVLAIELGHLLRVRRIIGHLRDASFSQIVQLIPSRPRRRKKKKKNLEGLGVEGVRGILDVVGDRDELVARVAVYHRVREVVRLLHEVQRRRGEHLYTKY